MHGGMTTELIRMHPLDFPRIKNCQKLQHRTAIFVYKLQRHQFVTIRFLKFK